MSETETDAPASPQWVAAHANALLYEVLARFASIGGGVQYSAIVDTEQFSAWREQAEHLADLAAHPDYGRSVDPMEVPPRPSEADFDTLPRVPRGLLNPRRTR